MTPAARVTAFVALLAAIFAGATLAGAALHPDAGDDGGGNAAGYMVGAHAGAGATAADLAYGHVHPIEQPGPAIAFDDTGGGEAGTQRLFLQFRHRGRVHTAAFTR